MSDSVLPHVPMDGKELLRALMFEAHLTAEDFATRLGMPKLQMDIQNYLDGNTPRPSWATFKPVAAFFNIRISALFDPAVAEQVALARGFIESSAPSPDIVDLLALPSVPLVKSSAGLAIPIYDVVVLLAAAVKPQGDAVRHAVCLLLVQLMTERISPEETLLIAAKIEDLL